MRQNGYTFVMLGRRDNFAWFTSGGDNKVFRSAEMGMGLLLIGHHDICLIAQYMDADRIYDDELQGADIDKITLKWYEQTPVEKAVEIVGDQRAVSDFDVSSEKVDNRLAEIYALHYPLTENEIKKYESYGKLCDNMLYDITNKIQPGMTEHEIEAIILHDYTVANMPIKVLLVSSDERIDRYRHPLASDKRVEKRVFLHPAAEKNGLHLNITRSIYYGKIPQRLLDKQNVLNLCEAQAMAMCKTGINMGEILEERKRILKDYGYEGEWKFHYPGAVSGYRIGAAQPFIDNERILGGMPFDLFITAKGAKVEEMCLSSDNGGINLTSLGKWPVETYEYNGMRYNIPVILQR